MKKNQDIYHGTKKAFVISELLGAILIIVGLIKMFNSNEDEFFIPVAICALGSISLIVGPFFLAKAEKYEREIADKFFYFAGDTLVIKKRHPFIGERLKVLDEREVGLRYDPLKIHVGGASVGGVFTGEVYTTGDKFYLQPGEKTGKYYLYYIMANDERTMRNFKKIEFREEAYEEAKNSSLSAKLGNFKYLENKGSKEYCQMLRNWISGVDY